MQIVPFETVLREACAAGCKPIAVYANDKAMQQEIVPLSDALKTFVKLDNRLFKQEMLQSNRMGHKRGAGIGEGLQSKRLQRSASADSMDTNRASAGDLDEYMDDVPFESGPPSRGVEGFGSPQDEDIPDLIELHGDSVQTPANPPPYESIPKIETGMSPELAQVSLHESNYGGPSAPPVQEMQERPSTQFLTLVAAKSDSGSSNGGAANGATLPDVSDGTLMVQKANGV
jgi:hypothetical protein